MLTDHAMPRRRFVGNIALGVAALRLRVAPALLGGTGCTAAALTAHGELESLSHATGWINSPALTAADVQGKVVLVQFWTFTCINWLRTMPYMRAWVDAYAKSGLVVVGAHTPEFPFERSEANVHRASRNLNVKYPVAVDTDYAIWNAFGNQYWPALYLLDAKGRVRHTQFGEGGYAETERMIQRLLRESGVQDVKEQIASVEGQGAEAPADVSSLRTEETYVGYGRAEHFASTNEVAAELAGNYVLPRELKLNSWGLAGNWTIRKSGIELNQPNGRIAFRFHARDAHLVMGTPVPDAAVRFRVTLDGQPPLTSHGADIDAQGNGLAKEQRLYQLIRQPARVTDRLLQIEFLGAGVEAYSFTFG